MALSKSRQEALTGKLVEAEDRLTEYEALWGNGDSEEIALNVERELRYLQGKVEALRTAQTVINFGKKAKGEGGEEEKEAGAA